MRASPSGRRAPPPSLWNGESGLRKYAHSTKPHEERRFSGQRQNQQSPPSLSELATHGRGDSVNNANYVSPDSEASVLTDNVEQLQNRIRTLEDDNASLSTMLSDILAIRNSPDANGVGEIDVETVRQHLQRLAAHYSPTTERKLQNTGTDPSIAALCSAADKIRERISSSSASHRGVSSGSSPQSTGSSYGERLAKKVGQSTAWRSLSTEQENERLRAEVQRLQTRISDLSIGTKKMKDMFASLMRVIKPIIEDGQGGKRYEETKQALAKVQDQLSAALSSQPEDSAAGDSTTARLREILQEVREQANSLKTELNLVKYERDSERKQNEETISALEKENKRLRKTLQMESRPGQAYVSRTAERAISTPIVQMTLDSESRKQFLSLLHNVIPLIDDKDRRLAESLFTSCENQGLRQIAQTLKRDVSAAEATSQRICTKALSRCESLDQRLRRMENRIKGSFMLHKNAQTLVYRTKSHTKALRKQVEDISHQMNQLRSSFDSSAKSIENSIAHVRSLKHSNHTKDQETALEKRKAEAAKKRKQLEERRKQLDAEAAEASQLLAKHSKERKKRNSQASQRNSQGLTAAHSSSGLVKQRSLSNLSNSNSMREIVQQKGQKLIDEEDVHTLDDSSTSSSSDEESPHVRGRPSTLPRNESAPSNFGGDPRKGLQRRKTLSQWLLRSKLSEEST